MTTDSAALRSALASGIAVEPEWRDAVGAVPRERFFGDAVFRMSAGGWEPVRRVDIAEDEWLRMAYADQTWVTQVDGVDAGDVRGSVTGNPTSSATLPSLVVRTAQVAGLRPGHKVLEIGTGTGYSTALLCHRLGAGNVVSIEYDAGLATRAAAHLRAAGYAPLLAVGDGLQGCKEHADYDAIVATCSVRSIPGSWFWQLREGGSITVDLSGWLPAAGLIRLSLDEDGVAHGRFAADPITYMLARPHERPPSPVYLRQDGEVRPVGVDPGLLDIWAGRFVAQLSVPSAELVETSAGVVLRDVATGSQAWTEGQVVHQHGPLRLWDQVESGLRAWRGEGEPGLEEFGMTATPWEQVVWIGSPEGPSWRLPV